MFRLADRCVAPLKPLHSEACENHQHSAKSGHTRTMTSQGSFVLSSRAPEGRHFPDSARPSDHLKFLAWGVNSVFTAAGLRRLGEKPNATSQKFFPSRKLSISCLEEWIDELAGEETVYLTQAGYSWGKKGEANRYRATADKLSCISVVYVDLDIYNFLGSVGNTDDELKPIVNSILETCRDAGIPDPLLISSGRGMYAYWALSKRLKLKDESVRKMWQCVQRRLMRALDKFGPDPKVIDLTRVLRLVGTVNEKSGATVRVLHDDGKRYSLECLERATSQISVGDNNPLGQEASTSQKSKSKKRKSDSAGSGNSKPGKSRSNRVAKSSEALKQIERSEWQAPGTAIAWLESLIAAESVIYAQFHKHQKSFYRKFRDIAKVVKQRNGIRIGERNEFILWMLVCRYHAGLCTVAQLDDWAARFSCLTEGGLVLSSKRELRDLADRMRQDISNSQLTERYIKNPEVRRIGAFSTSLYIRTNRMPLPIYAKGGTIGSKVYSPSVETLLRKLAITQEEQTCLETLINAAEKKRRRAETPAREHQRARKRDVIERHHAGESIANIARSLGKSQATIYRYLKEERCGTESGGQSGALVKVVVDKEKQRDSKRKLVVDLNLREPNLSLREVARNTGTPLTTVHRWLKLNRG